VSAGVIARAIAKGLRILVSSGHTQKTEWGRLGARNPSGAFECRGISSQYADRAGLRMTLMARTCRMFRRHFLMPNAKSGSCPYNDPALVMIVKDEGREMVLSLPFFPGC
jgi:hypothetical protein